MSRSWFLPALLLLLASGACRGPTEALRGGAARPAGAELPGPPWRSATSPDGHFACAWRVVGREEVPRNEDFELEVRLSRDERALPGAMLGVRGFMPDHGHGMVRLPRSVDRGDGSYRVLGMLFHMRGHWQLFFDFQTGEEFSGVIFDLEL